MTAPTSLDLHTLCAAYATGATTPEEVVDLVYERITARGADRVWIHLVPHTEARVAAAALAARRAAGEVLPLYGVPFAVKDNIDVAGRPTTAACPEFEYIATETAFVVQRLLAAGAILIGKTNLDQFATGLVGTRSPYGAPSCVFDERYISGGSSAGSSVAVAAGLVSFALGTDTAGSGRVPAAFNNLVGWKPTRGLLSNRGVVPACQTLDCVSVFALTCDDARAIMRVVAAYDEADPYSRPAPADGMRRVPSLSPSSFRFGVPPDSQLEFFGDAEAARLFAAAVARLEALGGERIEIDFSVFRETAELLYAGPWLAERLSAVSPFIDEHPEALHPVTARIIGAGRTYTAVDTFRAFYKLEALRRRAAVEWDRMDVLVVPTAGTIYTHEQLAAEPVQLNTNLGFYTNFVNLLDLCGVAVPAGFRRDGLPFGITLLAPAFHDDALCALAGRYHAAVGGYLGATAMELAALPPPDAPVVTSSHVQLAVVGAHLSGQPLNHQLTSRGARRMATTRTASDYELYALRGTLPPKPGLVRMPGAEGPGIEVEVWSVPAEAFGRFVAEVPPPLTIGTVELASGEHVKGFLCEAHAIVEADEITAFGGWRAYLGSQSAPRVATPDVRRSSASVNTA